MLIKLKFHSFLLQPNVSILFLYIYSELVCLITIRQALINNASLLAEAYTNTLYIEHPYTSVNGERAFFPILTQIQFIRTRYFHYFICIAFIITIMHCRDEER